MLLYTYACHEDEAPLCQLELRSLFGGGYAAPLAQYADASSITTPNGARDREASNSDSANYRNYVLSSISIDASRSPFIKQKLAVMFSGDSIQAITASIRGQELQSELFKVVYVETTGDDLTAPDYSGQRAVEREIGAVIRGKAEMRKPKRLFGIAYVQGQWLFGECETNQAMWLKHNMKPQHYSTALSTRMARAVANITVPSPAGVKAIDPCCGIGTVLVEALSMGIDMVGSDSNPLAVRGARINLAHFGLPAAVAIQDMRTLTGSYDAAVLDMPYNLCSVLSTEEQLAMLESTRRLAGRAVIISTEVIDSQIVQAGFQILDRCVARKGSFCRHVLVCV
ncbi:RNA methyltransferase [Paenibacillus sp. S3N08]|uniref:RNA methyltransferase n=2 Tax=Paenibacillus agricola TaxID=2716264 RepID=A0ABX0J0R7_9BACL|nr:RNA methyltransferase [Paenibacillus agricola]